jgi:type IV pilus assembly protein PilC
MSRALNVLSAQVPPGAIRRSLLRVRDGVESGATLAEAFEAQGHFPRFFLQLLAVGEESGTLERTLDELARFYEFQQRLWRSVISYLALPVFQYVAAVAVISLATHIISTLEDGPPRLVQGLCIGYGVPAALIAFYFLFVKPLGGTRLCHEAMLQVPVLGGVVRSLALARFSLVMYLMSESGVSVAKAVNRAFEATNNRAFSARAGAAEAAVDGGASLAEVLNGTGLFPRDYIDIVDVAEESGKLSERLSWLASHYADKAEFALRALAAVVARLVWAVVAAVIIVFIVKFFMRYAGALRGLST